MNERMTVTTERVDDLPVLLAQLVRMGVPALLDEHFPAHGNGQGLRLGWVTTVWVTQLVSQADHRLNQVERWAAARRETLCRCSGQVVRPADVDDDRLAAVVRALSDDARWSAFAHALTGQLLRVDDLRAERVRLDRTTASGSWAVTEDGLFQFGHSKDHRPDLPQVTVLLATLDPVGLPIATAVLSGERADDPRYLPAIARVRASVGRAGWSYVGDGKLAALATRASIAAHGDDYLRPLSARQWSAADLTGALAPVRAGGQALTPIDRVTSTGKTARSAEGDEWTAAQASPGTGHAYAWPERWLLIRSCRHAQAAEQALRARLSKAHAAVLALTTPKRGKRRLPAAAAIQQAADAIMAQQRVTGLLAVQVTTTTQARTVRGYRGRVPTVRLTPQVHVQATVDAVALDHAIQQVGWRVYVTNQPQEPLSLPQAVLAYRDAYLVERRLGRLKGQPLPLPPLYLERDDQATGLVRRLAIALRALTLLEFVVRRQLQQTAARVAGLSAGNPTRATAQPTAERLLAAFQDLTLTLLHTPQGICRHLTPLSTLHQQLLALLAFPPTIYTCLTDPFAQPP